MPWHDNRKLDLQGTANYKVKNSNLRRSSSGERRRSGERRLLEVPNIELYLQENHNIKIGLREYHKVGLYSPMGSNERIERDMDSMVYRMSRTTLRHEPIRQTPRITCFTTRCRRDRSSLQIGEE